MGDGHGRRRQITCLLRQINLPTSYVGHFPRRFSKKRQRHVYVTHTLTLGPGFVVYSRSISTLSISIRTRILGLLGRLRTRFGLACVFVSRSLTIIGFVDSHVVMIGRNHVRRVNPTRTVCHSPRATCARRLVGTVPVNDLRHVRRLRDRQTLTDWASS